MFQEKKQVLLISRGTYPFFPCIFIMSVIKFPGSVKNFSFHLGPNVFYNVTTFVYPKFTVKTISFPHCGSRLPTFTTESVAAERYRANNSLASLKIKTTFHDISLRTAQLVTLKKRERKEKKRTLSTLPNLDSSKTDCRKGK